MVRGLQRWTICVLVFPLKLDLIQGKQI
jgi:hypothetical protein